MSAINRLRLLRLQWRARWVLARHPGCTLARWIVEGKWRDLDALEER